MEDDGGAVPTTTNETADGVNDQQVSTRKSTRWKTISKTATSARVLSVAAIVISLCTLAAGLRQLNVQQGQLDQQKAALHEQAQEFSAAGPQFKVKAVAEVYDDGTWSVPSLGTVLPFTDQVPPRELNLILQVTNVGRSVGSIFAAGMEPEASQYSDLGATLCNPPSGPSLVGCQFPIFVSPQQEISIFVEVSTALTARLTCDSYSQYSLHGWIQLAGGSYQTVSTPIGTAYAGYCPQIPVRTDSPSG